MKLFIERFIRNWTGQYKDLGWINSWQSKSPKEYKRHCKKGHSVYFRQEGRGAKHFTCPQCRIKWSVDSGD